MKKVKFSVDTGYVGSERDEEFTLEELGIEEDDYDTQEELEKDIEAAYKEWLWENVNAHWDLID